MPSIASLHSLTMQAVLQCSRQGHQVTYKTCCRVLYTSVYTVSLPCTFAWPAECALCCSANAGHIRRFVPHPEGKGYIPAAQYLVASLPVGQPRGLQARSLQLTHANLTMVAVQHKTFVVHCQCLHVENLQLYPSMGRRPLAAGQGIEDVCQCCTSLPTMGLD